MGQDYIPSQEKSKQKRYQHLIDSFKAVVDQNFHPLSNISNFLALLKQQFSWWWVGFYFVSPNRTQQELLLGPFQGPLACTLIKKGKGVCGSAWSKGQTIIVKNVDDFEGHIACSSLSKSEIVIPIFNEKSIIGVLDIDSEKLAEFDEVDSKFLETMLDYLEKINTWKWMSQKF